MQKFNTKRRASGKELEKISERNRLLQESFLNNDEAFHAISRYASRIDGHINLGSAGNMHASAVKELKNIKNLGSKILKGADSYPGLGSTTFDIERDYVKFLKRWFGIKVASEEIAVFNGTFGSYRTITTASDKPAVLCPEIAYTRLKACLKASGKRVIEYKNTADGHIDLRDLDAKMARWKDDYGFVYINNPLGVNINDQYLSSLAKLLRKHDKFALYDLDTMYTAHVKDATACLPLIHGDFKKRALILSTLSKEVGAPGIRVGFAIGPKKLIREIRLHQEYVLEIIPTTSRAIASLLLEHADLKRAARELHERMSILTRGLDQLGWKLEMPATGINLYVPVPRSFTKISWTSPDTAFSFLMAKETGVRVRPGSIDGKAMREFVRFVISPEIPDVKDALQRLKTAGISYGMTLPKKLRQEYEKTIA